MIQGFLASWIGSTCNPFLKPTIIIFFQRKYMCFYKRSFRGHKPRCRFSVYNRCTIDTIEFFNWITNQTVWSSSQSWGEKKQTNKQPFALLSVTKTYSLILIASSGFLFFRWSIKRSAYFSTIGKIWKKSDKKMSNCYA